MDFFERLRDYSSWILFCVITDLGSKSRQEQFNNKKVSTAAGTKVETQKWRPFPATPPCLARVCQDFLQYFCISFCISFGISVFPSVFPLVFLYFFLYCPIVSQWAQQGMSGPTIKTREAINSGCGGYCYCFAIVIATVGIIVFCFVFFVTRWAQSHSL